MKKILKCTIFITSLILMFLFTGCNVSIKPVDNEKMFTEVKYEDWIEDANIKSDMNSMSNMNISKLKEGTEPTRFKLINAKCSNFKYLGYEYGHCKFDLMSDKDVTFTLNIVYDLLSNDPLYSQEISLTANEKQSIDCSFTTNFTVKVNDETNLLAIQFKMPEEINESTQEFKDYTSTKYIISNFEIYGGKKA